MGDTSRESSAARASRRRRWEVNSKESFQTELAVEVPSPYIEAESTKAQKEIKNDSTSPTKVKRPKTAKKSASKKEVPKIQSFKCENQSNNEGKSVSIEPLPEKLSEVIDTSADQDSPSASPSDRHAFIDTCVTTKASAPPLEPSPGKIKPLKRSRAKSVHPADPSSSKISKNLNDLNEDIVYSKREGHIVLPISGLIMDSASSMNNVNSNRGHISTIYCEKLDNFVLSKNTSNTAPEVGSIEEYSKYSDRAKHALFLQNGFRTFSLLIQGLLAGITVAHCLFVLLFGDNIIVKSAFMQTFFALIIFLTSVCLVSAFDRCDMAGQGIFSGHGIHFAWTPLFFLVSLILSLIMIRAEDLFANYHHVSSDIKDKGPDLFSWWRNLCVARTCFAVLGWIAVVADPNADILRNRIVQLT